MLICPNTEWLITFSHIDFTGISCPEEAAEDFLIRLADALDGAEFAKGKLSTCHGWNGALFPYQYGPVASYNTPIDGDIVDRVEKEWRADWEE